MTAATLRLLRVFLERPSAPVYGLELSRLADLKTGTIYPALARLEQARWLTSAWEEVDPRREGRPRRRLYELTPEGRQRALREFRALGLDALEPQPVQSGLPWNRKLRPT